MSEEKMTSLLDFSQVLKQNYKKKYFHTKHAENRRKFKSSSSSEGSITIKDEIISPFNSPLIKRENTDGNSVINSVNSDDSLLSLLSANIKCTNRVREDTLSSSSVTKHKKKVQQEHHLSKDTDIICVKKKKKKHKHDSKVCSENDDNILSTEESRVKTKNEKNYKDDALNEIKKLFEKDSVVTNEVTHESGVEKKTDTLVDNIKSKKMKRSSNELMVDIQNENDVGKKNDSLVDNIKSKKTKRRRSNELTVDIQNENNVEKKNDPLVDNIKSKKTKRKNNELIVDKQNESDVEKKKDILADNKKSKKTKRKSSNELIVDIQNEQENFHNTFDEKENTNKNTNTPIKTCTSTEELSNIFQNKDNKCKEKKLKVDEENKLNSDESTYISKNNVKVENSLENEIIQKNFKNEDKNIDLDVVVDQELLNNDKEDKNDSSSHSKTKPAVFKNCKKSFNPLFSSTVCETKDIKLNEKDRYLTEAHYSKRDVRKFSEESGHDSDNNLDLLHSSNSKYKTKVIKNKEDTENSDNEIKELINDINTEEYENSDNDTEEFLNVSCSKSNNSDSMLSVDIDELLEESSKENIPSELKEKVKFLAMALPFEVPELHHIETRMTAAITPKQKKEIADLGLEYISGPFTKLEDEHIQQNWKDFCKTHDFDSKEVMPFLNLCNIEMKHQRVKFVRYLARNLNNRLLNSVYKRFKVLYRPDKKGKFSDEENKLIIKFMSEYKGKNKFAALAKILKRDKVAVIKRYTKLINDLEGKLTQWIPSLIREFLIKLMEVTLTVKTEELRDRKIEPEEWAELSKIMQIPILKLKLAWKTNIYPKLFVEEDFAKIKKDVIKRLYKKEIEDWREINWNEMAEKYDYCTGVFLYKVIKDMVRKNVPKEIQNNARKSIKFLKKHCPLKVQNTNIHKISFEDKKLCIIEAINEETK